MIYIMGMLKKVLENNYIESGLWLLTLIPSYPRYWGYRQKYDIHDSFHFNGAGIRFQGEGEIFIGKGSYLGEQSFLNADEGCSINIGENCALGHYIRIYTSNYTADQDFGEKPRSLQKGNVEIGDNVWIGAFTLITEDTIIGRNAVIGAHATVTNDIPPHSIAVGSPAKVVGFKSYLSENDIDNFVEEYPAAISEQSASLNS